MWWKRCDGSILCVQLSLQGFWNCFNLSRPCLNQVTVSCQSNRAAVKSTETRQLSSHGLFLNWASVRRHIVRSRPCFGAQLRFREIHVQARAGDVMTAGGGSAGPAPSTRQQPPGAMTRRVTPTYNMYLDLSLF